MPKFIEKQDFGELTMCFGDGMDITAVGNVIGKIDLTPAAIATGWRTSERLFNGKENKHLFH
ncbi:hypothetical protein NRIC_35500 [Enterococcus florum]|uniref:Uncharacterized protein n=1 Tax=Enterococcus florum TaxID=2480627 RepID=A0A4V0WQ03_9ENTE|nr:hypothetical protein [Enterococcus florum]GCF95659.1 hypothetical protein NRIC_35500 [Enterococcus florum]